MSFLLPCFRYRCGLLCCFSAAGMLPGFQLPPAVLACLLVWLLPVSAAAAGPLFASRLPGGRASLLPFLLPVCFQASSCRRGYAVGAGLPSLLPVCFQASSCRRSGAAAGIFFYKFNSFLCWQGYFLFWDPVKLPGIEALYQTIYNYDIYKTIQDHFSSCLFLLPGQKIPLVIFLLPGTPYFQGFLGYRQNIFEFFQKRG